jgi:hypothetical protein
MASVGTKNGVLVALLAAGRSYDEVAAEAGVSRRTIVRRMADPSFQREVRAARARVLDEVLGLLAKEAAATVRTLVALRDGAEGDATRLGACRTLLDKLVAARELLDLEGRLTALERRR